jgi:opacity protein-like surface antigen
MLIGVAVREAAPNADQAIPGECRCVAKEGQVMVASYRSILAGAVLLACSGAGAGAADLYGSDSIKDMPAAYAHPARFYLRGDYSYAWTHSGDLQRAILPFDSVSVDNAWAAGGGLGYYFGRGVRGDVTYEWRGSTDVAGRGTTASTDFDFKTQLILANLYYDFRPGERFTPYIGVGLGAARHSSSGGTIVSTCGVVCSYDGEKDWTVAGAFMAGLSLRLDRGGHAPVSIKDHAYAAPEPGRLHLDVGYRFLYLGDVHTGNIIGTVNPTPGPRLEDVTAHEFRVGLRWDIR